ncbi:MAG: hypothetical protein LBQ22_13010 [Bacteroidales bacterium]|jgi:hypothetical protein|nr:hypothetical protein [Bacteroidales bacterium]
MSEIKIINKGKTTFPISKTTVPFLLSDAELAQIHGGASGTCGTKYILCDGNKKDKCTGGYEGCCTDPEGCKTVTCTTRFVWKPVTVAVQIP